MWCLLQLFWDHTACGTCSSMSISCQIQHVAQWPKQAPCATCPCNGWCGHHMQCGLRLASPRHELHAPEHKLGQTPHTAQSQHGWRGYCTWCPSNHSRAALHGPSALATQGHVLDLACSRCCMWSWSGQSGTYTTHGTNSSHRGSCAGSVI